MVQDSPLLRSQTPTSSAPANVYIGHPQLRELIVCSRERGVVNYVKEKSIIEHDIVRDPLRPRVAALLSFTPNTIASLPIQGTDHVLLAAGGLGAEVHISVHAPSPSRSTSGSSSSTQPSSSASSSSSRPSPSTLRPHRPEPCPQLTPLRQFELNLTGAINNSIFLTSLNLSGSPGSSVEPRMAISNNDNTVRFYDIPVRGSSPPPQMTEVGTLRLDVPVNHSSLSPDGSTLISVGDSPKVYLHNLTGGSRITFTRINTLTLPPSTQPSIFSPYSAYNNPIASFSTAFSTDGTKFAVACQEGMVVIWDVRSSKPLKVLETDRQRIFGRMSNWATAWSSDDNFDSFIDDPRELGNSTIGSAYGAGVRSVKFSPAGSGKEVMTFTEHTSMFHVVDAQTFETEEIVRMPSINDHAPRPQIRSPSPLAHSPARSSILPSAWLSMARTRAPTNVVPTPRPGVQALEDTFRIPSASTSRRRPEGEDFVVIPSLGDRTVDFGVQALLGRHMGTGYAIRGSRFEELGELDAETEDPGRDEEADVDVDTEMEEMEVDCLPSHTPSRAGSPSPPSIGPTRSPFTALGPPPPLQEQPHELEEPGVDLAGVCFDTTGRWLYVASTQGVAEWGVRGAEKKWWGGGTWA